MYRQMSGGTAVCLLAVHNTSPPQTVCCTVQLMTSCIRIWHIFAACFQKYSSRISVLYSS